MSRGSIDPVLAMPVMLGVIAGSTLGARVLARADTRILCVVFSLVILALGAELFYNGLTGRIQEDRMGAWAMIAYKGSWGLFRGGGSWSPLRWSLPGASCTSAAAAGRSPITGCSAGTSSLSR